VIALVLGLFLVQLGLTTLQRIDRHRSDAVIRHDALVANRVVWTTLRRELGLGVASLDWRVGTDTLALRAFRGVGIVCGVGTDSSLVVSYRGDRRVDPTKDSVEVTSEQGVRVHVGLRSAVPASPPCPGARAGESTERWLLADEPGGQAVVARIFESGSYHLANSALRYRIGAGGRQPLTAEVWDDSRTRFVVRDSSVELELGHLPGYGPDRTLFLAWRGRK